MRKGNNMFLTYTVFIMSIIFIICGVCRDEVNVVLTKAINICLECIGIG